MLRQRCFSLGLCFSDSCVNYLTLLHGSMVALHHRTSESVADFQWSIIVGVIKITTIPLRTLVRSPWLRQEAFKTRKMVPQASDQRVASKTIPKPSPRTMPRWDELIICCCRQFETGWFSDRFQQISQAGSWYAPIWTGKTTVMISLSSIHWEIHIQGLSGEVHFKKNSGCSSVAKKLLTRSAPAPCRPNLQVRHIAGSSCVFISRQLADAAAFNQQALWMTHDIFSSTLLTINNCKPVPASNSHQVCFSLLNNRWSSTKARPC